MAKTQVVLALDSGALIAAEKDERVEAIIRKWLREGAHIVVPAPVVAETIRGRATDAAANRLLKAVGLIAATTDAIARDAGTRLGKTRSSDTIDAITVATAVAHGATDVLTSDPNDISRFVPASVNVIRL